VEEVITVEEGGRRRRGRRGGSYRRGRKPSSTSRWGIPVHHTIVSMNRRRASPSLTSVKTRGRRAGMGGAPGRWGLGGPRRRRWHEHDAVVLCLARSATTMPRLRCRRLAHAAVGMSTTPPCHTSLTLPPV
jgi:hypothetical protein